MWERRLSSLKNKNQTDSIEELGLGIRSMAFRKGFGERDPRTDMIFDQIQHAILTIPGHAEYYRDRILDAQERFKKREGQAPWSDYDREQMYGFQTLVHLPSPETVRVYGDLLSNHWLPPGNETAPISEKRLPLSQRALSGITKLPIRDKPFKIALTQENLADAHAAWLQWYEQIKDGRRTFRFEGDPVEYDLNGPAPGQKVDRIARDTKRERERAAGRRDAGPRGGQPADSSVETPSKSAPAALIAAGALALGTLVWYVSRARVSKEP